MPRDRGFAMCITRFGEPGVFEQIDVEEPVPEPGEMVVEVHACGVCGHDVLARRGLLGSGLPLTLGHEIAGVVVSANGAGQFSEGDRVVLNQRVACGRCAHCTEGATQLCRRGGFYGDDLPGGYGRYVRARPTNAVHLPAAIDFVQAAAIPCGVCTPLHAMRQARLSEGSRVLITGASGGVGINAIRLSRSHGAERVVAVIRDDAARTAVQSAGATDVVVADGGAGEAFSREVRALFPEGVDAVLECAGTPTLEQSVRSVRRGGRVAVVGNVNPGEAGPTLGMLILREVEVVGSSHASVRELEQAVSMVARGEIDPAIADVLPVTQAAIAHELVEGGNVGGKVVLSHDPGDDRTGSRSSANIVRITSRAEPARR